ncbi:MAG TPA: hypothetical protein VLL52_00080 [Anaerolineae bacterium]|nr:hypothetical protein [Anaerolineae bacterium]
MKKNVFHFCLMVYMLLLASCQTESIVDPSQTLETTRQIKPTRIVPIDPTETIEVTNEIVLTHQSNPTLPVIPTQRATPVSYPDEFSESWDKLINYYPDCDDYCWESVMLGQTEKEAVANLYSYLGSDISLNIIEYPTKKVIEWPSQTWRFSRSAIIIDNDQVIRIRIDNPERVVLATVLEELGEPQFVSPGFAIIPDGYPVYNAEFILFYPEQRVVIRFKRSSMYDEPYLDLGSPVASIDFELNELPTEPECYPESVMIKWQGTGGEGVYYGANVLELPKECDN